MTGIGLTPRQATLLAFLESEAAAGRPSPSFQEMADHLGLRSKAGIHRLVTGLEERGHLVRLPHRARALGVAAPGAEGAPLPAVPLPAPVATRLRAYCARRRLAAREVIADALSDYMARNP